METDVILVDENDNEIGRMPKHQAHLDGKLHRAISVFVFNSHRELLLQQRHPKKYHSGSLWTNTCCSHPFPGEDVTEAAQRRLMEEMGMNCSLTKIFDFCYKTTFLDGLTEYEFDHVFMGLSDEKPQINPVEVADFKFRSLSEIERDLDRYPDHYTYWFKLIYKRVFDYL